jgi:biofilm PGA synthesis N-glycosyltransferase PgaC
MSREIFVVITPAKNEADYLPKTIESIVKQNLLPSEWIIVDDGSNDNTGEIATNAASKYSWIKVITRIDRGYRDLGVGVVEAMTDGINRITVKNYEFMFNIDADIILPPTYFEKLIVKFKENPKLGIAAGAVLDQVGERLIPMRTLPLGFNGMVRCWRRKCFQEIGGIPRGLAWDGLDCYQAIMLGWETETFTDLDLQVIHMRPEKSSVKNKFHGWARHGRALHFSGAHPIWVLSSALYHMLDRPYVLSGFCLLLGYLGAWMVRQDRFGDKQFRKFLRTLQMKKLASLLKLT